VKPYLVVALAPGVPHREVGSWTDLLANPDIAGQAFHPTEEWLRLRYRVEAAIVHEHDPAGTTAAYPAGWVFDRLTETFGEGSVKDLDSIEYATRPARCSSPTRRTAAGPRGTRRCRISMRTRKRRSRFHQSQGIRAARHGCAPQTGPFGLSDPVFKER
jgi:hypothetical protein